MKKILMLLMVTVVLFGCEKAETPNALTNPFNGGPGSFTGNWTSNGVGPFSVRVDGVKYLAKASDISVTKALGLTNISVNFDNGIRFINISLVDNSAPGVTNTPSPNNFTYSVPLANEDAMATSHGKIKIIQMTNNLLEGQFYSPVRNPADSLLANHNITEGYFKVNY